MRYFIVSSFFIVTLSIMVWMTLKPEDTRAENCEETDKNSMALHQEYLAQYGWDIKSDGQTCKVLINYYPEYLDVLEGAGLDLEPYNKKGIYVLISTYKLKQTEPNGDHLTASIYEIDDQIIGGYGGLKNWIPGLFPLGDKERMISDGTILPDKK